MLNLQIAMVKELLFTLISVFWMSGLANTSPVVEITSPSTGQVLQGNVNIAGTISADNFSSAELLYAYSQNENSTWFPITMISQPVSNGILGIWDTSTISDGDYKIKLAVKTNDGNEKEVVIDKMLVRNYTPVESTPTPKATVVPLSDLSATAIPTQTATPTTIAATPFPANPGALTTNQIDTSLKNGLIVGLVLIISAGIYLFFRNLRFHR